MDNVILTWFYWQDYVYYIVCATKNYIFGGYATAYKATLTSCIHYVNVTKAKTFLRF